MQAVILAGGLGTRLRPLTEGVPKAMVMVHGKPFLEYQIRLLLNGGITSLVLCIGHLGQHIREYFGDGGSFGVDIRYSDDGDTLLGTAGALKRAEPLLADDFFLIYGDSYLFLDYRAIMDFFRRRHKLALMVVYRNEDSREPSNVVTGDGFVLAYDKETHSPDMTHINFGASVIRKQALSSVPPSQYYTQEELYADLIQKQELLAYEVYDPYYEVGSREGLAAFDRLVATGAVAT
jgi:NDP-sugar pyrophosphorylase family protein